MDAVKLNRVSREIKLPDGQRIVLLDAPTDGSWSKQDCQANVYRLDAAGNVVWQVQATAPKFDTDSFVSISMKADKLEASRFFGSEFEIDLATGVTEEVGWHK
jgi:hypothetical protein